MAWCNSLVCHMRDLEYLSFPLCPLSSTLRVAMAKLALGLRVMSTRSLTEVWLHFKLQLVKGSILPVCHYHSYPLSSLPEDNQFQWESNCSRSYSQDTGGESLPLDWTVCFIFRMNYKCLSSAHFPGTYFIWQENLSLWTKIWYSRKADSKLFFFG